MSLSILVVAAHPDDEVLGCGGTLAKLAKEDSLIHVAFLADGVFSRVGSQSSKERELLTRRTAATKACEVLGVNSISFDEFPDNRMDAVDILDIAKVVEKLVAKYQPSMVFTHHAGDLNVDHRRTNEAVVIACRPQQGNPVKTLLSFEVPSSTEWQLAGSAIPFQPTWYTDISDSLALKIQALNLYTAEMRDWPHPRSIQGVEHLAHWRGACIGVDAAEAFMLGRHII